MTVAAVNPCNFLKVFPCWSGLDIPIQELDDPRWKRVVVLKHDVQGNIILNRTDRQLLRTTYIKDSSTGDLYLNDDMVTAATKCAWIMLGVPIYTYIYMAFNLLRIPYDIYQIGKRTLEAFNTEWAQNNVGNAVAALATGIIWEIPRDVVLDLWNVVRAPFFAIAVFFAALYGVCVDAYVGRVYEAYIEHLWQHRVSRRQDFNYIQPPERMNDSEACMYKMQHASAFYFAYCMQIKGNMSDPISATNPQPRYIEVSS